MAGPLTRGDGERRGERRVSKNSGELGLLLSDGVPQGRRLCAYGP
jgi:hypothetical protein